MPKVTVTDKKGLVQSAGSGVDIVSATALATVSPVSAGRGILSASAGTYSFGPAMGLGTVYKTSVVTVGNIIYTDILIDLTGLDSATSGSIIGHDAIDSSEPTQCHIGQINASVNGTIFGGSVTCLEVPAGGDADIDLFYADEATGAHAAAITSLTNDKQVTNNGDHTIGRVTPFMDASVTSQGSVLGAAETMPADGKYLYLVDSGGTDVTYSAGRLLIRMYGYNA